MLLLFGVLVAVFAVPVSAKKLDDGVTLNVTSSKNMFIATTTTGHRPVMEDMPYIFTVENDGWMTVKKTWDGKAGPMIRGSDSYIDMTFTVGDGSDLVDVAFDSVQVMAGLYGSYNNLDNGYGKFAYELAPSSATIAIDGSVGSTDIVCEYGRYSSSFTQEQMGVLRTIVPWSGKVSRTFSCDFHFNSSWSRTLENIWEGTALENDNIWDYAYFKFRIVGLTVNDVPTPVENIELKVGEISTTVKNIENGVVDINSNLVDMKDQLSNPDSSIWSAGSSAIGEKVGELFTPSADDLTTATGALKDTMTDKLGGAYDAVEAVTGAGGQMRDKLKNPTPSQSITFPGISVPSAGMVEGFTILPSMEVTLPPKLTAVLQPVAGAIVCVLVGMYTLSSLKDMVICFMSSMSYAEYLHRNKGGGSE